MLKENYFIVTAKCGHVGKGKYVEKDLTIKAENAKEAALKAKYYPRVKHDWKDAIVDVVEVDKDEYWRIRVNNYSDPYFNVKNVQDQRLYCDELYKHVKTVETTEYSKKKRVERIRYLMKKRKLEERFSRLY